MGSNVPEAELHTHLEKSWLLRFSADTVVFTPISSLTYSESLGGCDDVVFSGHDGVFMNSNLLAINGLRLSAKIMRHSAPDYQTQLVSS